MQWLRRLSLLDVALLISGAALVVVVLWLSVLLVRGDQWKPLGPFPTQEVAADDVYLWETAGPANTVKIPAVDVDDGVVSVSGTKCYREAVTVVGVVAWQVLEPPHPSVETGRGTALREPGCFTPDGPYTNEIPVEIAEHAREHGPIVVAITGCETPSSPNRGEGATLCWSTEPFALVP